MTSSWTLLSDPLWPWSIPGFGLLALALTAVVLVVLTVWTYLGVRNASFNRVLIILGLRLLALLATLVALIRPSLAQKDELHVPSLLLLASDGSESMTIQDEPDSQTRWAYQIATLKKCQPILTRLRDEDNVNVLLYRFAGNVGDFNPDAPPQGKRTDIGGLLQNLYEKHRQEKFFRGLIVLSDGADNGTRYSALTLASQWRGLPCPIHTVGFGKDTTSDRQNDIAFVSINPEPSPVAVKGELIVKGTVDAPGFEHAKVRVQVLFELPFKITDDWLKALRGAGVPEGVLAKLNTLKEKEFATREQFESELAKILDKDERERYLDLVVKRAVFEQPVAAQEETLEKTVGNEVKIKTTAPSKPGEIKVTLKIDPQPGETSVSNNEITTYLTVIKEGISVLLVDKERAWEPQFIADALRTEPRVRLYTMWMRGQKPLDAAQKDLFAFEKQHYDVIILGDVSALSMKAADPTSLKTIERLVFEKGTGLMMMGGNDSFGPSWIGTEIETLLPVKLEGVAGQLPPPIKMLPTEEGLAHFALRLNKTPEESKVTWESLRALDGCNRLGPSKPGAQVLARATDHVKGPPVMVSQPYGQGRTMAFAGDTTNRWRRNPDGVMTHKRFWVNLVLWLAKQEETEGNVWVIPDTRRLAAGNKLGFTLGMKGKNGTEIKDAKLKAKVIAPNGGETMVDTKRDDNKERGVFWNTDQAGEYKVVVTGEGTDVDGTKLTGEASARFVVYQDDAELMRRAANHDFLKKLADKGGGQFLRPEELQRFLEELQKQPLLVGKPKVAAWPDWKSNQMSGFLPLFLLVFVALLTGEWVLRRRWGLV